MGFPTKGRNTIIQVCLGNGEMKCNFTIRKVSLRLVLADIYIMGSDKWIVILDRFHIINYLVPNDPIYFSNRLKCFELFNFELYEYN